MNPRTALVAFALVSLPAAVEAQTLSNSIAPSTPTLLQAVALTRAGVHAAPSEVVGDGLEIVDSVRVDVDGDGDEDVLAFINLAADADVDKPDLGRGVAVIFRDQAGWRGETVASVARFPTEAGFNWGEVEGLRAGEVPLLHVLYSEAQPGGEARQMDTVVRFDHGALREVFASRAGVGAERVSVRARDIDGDGTSEILERVRTDAHCGRRGCVAASEAQRVFRWDGASRRFVESASRVGAAPIAGARTRRGSADTVVAVRVAREH
jgi:hypothetical protein